MYVFANGISLGSGGNQSGQIIFPATQNASSNVNTLDDYEEGTWTPSTSTTNLSVSTINYASYQKVGKWVKAFCYIVITNTGAATNFVLINGLPFVSAASYFGVLVSYTANGVADGSTLYNYVDASNTSFRIAYVNNSIPNGATGFMFMAIYEASA